MKETSFNKTVSPEQKTENFSKAAPLEMIEPAPHTPEESFHPENELGRILKLPTQERKQALSTWKEKYAEQRTELAILQAKLVSFAREHRDVTIDQLSKIVDQENEKHHFTEEQLAITRSAIELYGIKHKIVTAIRERFPEDKELFKEIFGIYPHGKIQITVSLVTLNITCTNRIDFARLRDYDSEKLVVFRELIRGIFGERKVGVSFGDLQYMPELNGAVIAEDASSRRDRGSGNSMIHEEQHSLLRLWNQIETTYKISHPTESTGSPEETERSILRRCTENIHSRIADELLARLKSREDGYRNSLTLIQSSYLDVFLKYEKVILLQNGNDPKILRVIAELESKKFRDKLEGELQPAILAYEIIYGRLQLTHEEIAMLLAFEPLGQWIKIANRLTDELSEPIEYPHELSA